MLRSLVRFFLLVVILPTSILTAPSIAAPQKKEYFNYFSIQSVSADHARDRGSHFVAISKSFLPNKNMGSGYKDNEAFSPTNEKVRTETGPRRIDTLPLATQFEGVKSLVTSQPGTTPVVDSRSRDGLSSRLTCDVCKTFIGLLQRLVAEQRTTEDIVKIAIVFCKAFKIEDDRVCELVVPEFQEMVLAVVRGTLFSPDEICGIVLGNTCATPYDPMAMWNITISNKLKPPVKPHTPPKPGSPVVRVLHVTDIHLDAEYTPDADAECGEPLCCRAFDTNPAPTPSRRAGQWGDYRDCDSPWSTVENLFRHFSDIRDEFDYVIFTGDIPAHDVWNQTRTAQLTSLRRIADLFRKYLPDKPVYTCMGNHESVPVNSYPPDSAADQSMEWLYSANMQAWGYWLPTSTYSTIFRGAFYEFSPYPGFRIISINSNYGTNRNWWLLLNATDPQGQLQWLADVLQDAEDKGDKVHLLYHHPPGDVLNAFSVNFYRLVNRYESTIAGQFNGHTHTDEYRVFYDMQNKSRPVGVAYIGGSVTPGGKLNPAYRIYTVDGNYTGSSWEVLDYKQYYFDLTQANQGGSLSWRYEYTPKVAYSMDNLYPEDWSKLIYRMKANDTLFQIYNGISELKMTSVEPSSRVGVALDLILKTLISSQDFNNLASKNWETIARLIPGTTPSQCARRYDELLTVSGIMAQHSTKAIASSGNVIHTSLSESDLSARHSTNEPSKHKESKNNHEKTSSLGGTEGTDKGEQSPTMVIHVCDEAKSLKKDFYCPRDLLVSEMKYFAEYLSTDTQRCEEVDISVHCDVQIFDWLIKYVKRGTKEIVDPPHLEASNVVSILISSDFLKMDNLVQECIDYCHQNMTAIVSTNCNMNCINDRLINRITDLFTHSQADDIKDRKDKFKSKLFAKKLEKLFSPDYSSVDSPENASTLFRCSVCHRILTVKLEKKVRCMPSRMTIDRNGKLMYSHVRDAAFDVNNYILELKTQLKTWRDVYWRIWGTINSLTCSRCGDVFPLTEFGHCRYHPEPPQYDNNDPGSLVSCVGIYPCCHLRTLRFDPLQLNKGCRVKDHIVNLSETKTGVGSGEPDSPMSHLHHIYDTLLAKSDAVCVSFQRLSDFSDMTVDVFANEIYACHSHTLVTPVPSLSRMGQDDKNSEAGRPPPSLQALTIEREVSGDDDEFGGSDDEVGDDESHTQSGKKPKASKKSRVTIDPQAILLHAPVFDQTKKSMWDAQRSMRYNQDAQRQEDQRRMKEIRLYLTKLRLNPDKVDRPKKEYAGGIFSKLEAQWKAAQAPQPNKQIGPLQIRGKVKPPNSFRSSMI